MSALKQISIYFVITIFVISSIGVNIIKHTCGLCGTENNKIEIFSLADNQNCCDIVKADNNCLNSNSGCCHINHSGTTNDNNHISKDCCKFSNIFLKLKILIFQLKQLNDIGVYLILFNNESFNYKFEEKSQNFNFYPFKILLNTDLIFKHCRLII